MKIIAGKYKGMIVNTSTKYDYRPSTAKLREAIFSILSSGYFIDIQPLENAKILDLFAGSAILSFEAISRGADSALLVDVNKAHLNHAVKFADKIGISDKILTLHINALNLSRIECYYDIVFIDPPYYSNMISSCVESLIRNGWLRAGSILVIEMGYKEKTNIPESCNIIKEKFFGNSKLLIVQYEG